MKTARVRASDMRQYTPVGEFLEQNIDIFVKASFFVSRTGVLHVRSSEASLESA